MLWFPRLLQGEGRHDNPDLYGCLYAAAEPVGAIAETLAPFRGSGRLDPSMLRRGGRPLYLGRLALADGAGVLDLDDPEVLRSSIAGRGWSKCAGGPRPTLRFLVLSSPRPASRRAWRWPA